MSAGGGGPELPPSLWQLPDLLAVAESLARELCSETLDGEPLSVEEARRELAFLERARSLGLPGDLPELWPGLPLGVDSGATAASRKALWTHTAVVALERAALGQAVDVYGPGPQRDEMARTEESAPGLAWAWRELSARERELARAMPAPLLVHWLAQSFAMNAHGDARAAGAGHRAGDLAYAPGSLGESVRRCLRARALGESMIFLHESPGRSMRSVELRVKRSRSPGWGAPLAPWVAPAVAAACAPRKPHGWAAALRRALAPPRDRADAWGPGGSALLGACYPELARRGAIDALGRESLGGRGQEHFQLGAGPALALATGLPLEELSNGLRREGEDFGRSMGEMSALVQSAIEADQIGAVARRPDLGSQPSRLARL